MPLGHQTCIDCQTKSPETELNYSLLGLAGWREMRVPDGSGGVKVEWRCPACWTAFKRRTRAQTQTNLPKLETVVRNNRKE